MPPSPKMSKSDEVEGQIRVATVTVNIWARYLRKVHVEWCPWKPGAIAPAWLAHVSTPKIAEAVPKLNVSHKMLPKPKEGDPFVDRTPITYADGSTDVFTFEKLKLRDILDEVEMASGRIAAIEQKRGKTF